MQIETLGHRGPLKTNQRAESARLVVVISGFCDLVPKIVIHTGTGRILLYQLFWHFHLRKMRDQVKSSRACRCATFLESFRPLFTFGVRQNIGSSALYICCNAHHV